MKVVFLWLLMVLVLSVISFNGSIRGRVPHAEQIFHFTIYAITSALFYTEFLRSKRHLLRKNAMILAFLLAAGYGVLMEVIQLYTSSRRFSLLDIEFNALGAAIGLVIVLFLRGRKK